MPRLEASGMKCVRTVRSMLASFVSVVKPNQKTFPISSFDAHTGIRNVGRLNSLRIWQQYLPV
eukprot:3424449-Amphidinium_carterae.1